MIDPASFRDPSGFVFRRDGRLLRQVNSTYREDYDAFTAGGLYDALVETGLLVPHEEVPLEEASSDAAYKVLEPQEVPFISFPYEWCFGQLKDAALATLECQRLALEHDMVLKDASAYNIQFLAGRAVMIDTLSFERRLSDSPWIAYRQFCQHFLAPLALASYVDIRLLGLSARHIDGVPLDLASRLLPTRTRLRFGILIHLHLHAASQRKYSSPPRSGARKPPRPVTRQQLLGIVDHLKSTIRKLDWRPTGTEWADYTGTTHYSDADRSEKARLVEAYLRDTGARTVLDLGANTGVYSRVAAGLGCRVLSCDGDPAAVEKNHRALGAEGEEGILPLWIDLANPSPSLGWASRERPAWSERSQVDAVLVLALVHHLAIGNNVPLERIAEHFRELAPNLIIEWVPKEDDRVQQLLSSREDVFADYDRAGFERAFGRFFSIEKHESLGETERTLYLMSAGDEGLSA